MNRDGYLLDYSRLNHITIQTWSPYKSGFPEGDYVGNRERFGKLNEVMDRLSESYGVTPTGIVAAWILRHPAKMQVVSGTTKTSRLEEMVRGSKICLTRQEWYELYMAAGHILP